MPAVSPRTGGRHWSVRIGNTRNKPRFVAPASHLQGTALEVKYEVHISCAMHAGSDQKELGAV